MIKKVLQSTNRVRRRTKSPEAGCSGAQRQYSEGGSGKWIPFASFCTTGQFNKLGRGYIRHCGPTAAVNVIRTLDNYVRNENENSQGSRTAVAGAGKTGKSAGMDPEKLFLMCAEIGRRTHIYWNTEILGRFGGTSNALTKVYLRDCLRAAGKAVVKARIRFHVWITPDAVEKAVCSGAIVYLQVYRHPRYQNHHMLCYGCRRNEGKREFLLADGWSPYPVWVGDRDLGRGHYLTIRCR